jgi:hypothetical protein
MPIKTACVKNNFDSAVFFSVAQQSKSCLDRLTVEVSRSHTIRHINVRTPLNEGSARQNTQLIQERASMSSLGFCFVRPFFRSVLFIHCVPLDTLSSCHLLLYNTPHKHPCPQRDFFVLPCTLFVLHPYLFLM